MANASSDKLFSNGVAEDLEMANLEGSSKAKFGPYSFVWADGEDYYAGVDFEGDSTAAAYESSSSRSKVGGNKYKKGMAAASLTAEDEQR